MIRILDQAGFSWRDPFQVYHFAESLAAFISFEFCEILCSNIELR